jgi:hypothetical protein
VYFQQHTELLSPKLGQMYNVKDTELMQRKKRKKILQAGVTGRANVSFIDSDGGVTPDPRWRDTIALEWQGNVTGMSV